MNGLADVVLDALLDLGVRAVGVRDLLVRPLPHEGPLLLHPPIPPLSRVKVSDFHSCLVCGGLAEGSPGPGAPRWWRPSARARGGRTGRRSPRTMPGPSSTPTSASAGSSASSSTGARARAPAGGGGTLGMVGSAPPSSLSAAAVEGRPPGTEAPPPLQSPPMGSSTPTPPPPPATGLTDPGAALRPATRTSWRARCRRSWTSWGKSR